jgi:hypothetical protein
MASNTKDDEMATAGEVRPQGAIVPYAPDQIKVEKHGSKRTASVFCGHRRLPDDAGKARFADSRRMHAGKASSSCGDSGAVTMSPANESDVSDTFSVVSDVSDLSCMSLPQSAGFSTDFARRRCSASVLLAGVHGRGVEGRSSALQKRPSVNDQAAVVLWRPPRHRAAAARAELTRLQDDNFALRRENVNLKSLIDSLKKHHQEQQRLSPALTMENSLKLGDGLVAVDGQESAHQRAVLRAAQDEALKLREMLSLSENDATASQNQVLALKEKLRAATDELQNVSDQLKSFKETSETAAADAGCALKDMRNRCQTLEADLAAATESVCWYKEQLQTHQQAKSDVQKELAAARREVSARSAVAAELEARLEEVQATAEAEREDTAAKLRRIEREVAEQEGLAAELHREKDAAIAQLSERLSENAEGHRSLDAVQHLSESVAALETTIDEMKAALQLKEDMIEKLKEDKLKFEVSSSNSLEALKASEKAKQSLQCQLERQRSDVQTLGQTAKDALHANETWTKIMLGKLSTSMDDLDQKWNGFSARSCERAQEAKERFQALSQSNTELQLNLTKALEELASVKAEAKDMGERLSEANEAREQHQQEKDVLRQDAQANLDEVQRLQALLQDVPAPEELARLQQLALRTEQAEREAADVRQNMEDVEAAKLAAAEKAVEREKEAEEEIERLRALVLQKEDQLRQVKTETVTAFPLRHHLRDVSISMP